ncbi:DUF2470 domain-containing protein [Microbacterium allomyrinae]|jgi:hypothetical protein|uniref:DUF2470 domain-containing protein n=1 Tax=Microbacterium allomyrinae TaxID=2830666 RepID=A0A9X1LV87_9MICO|nr:DUF2470 domain-containing protein [Microbacterium allomyrinae]MCC2032704.1 DUF2470 domain-containing protein [Microbacterium allomyrinae]
MTHLFDDAVLAGVLGHMNGDHGDDNLLISRAFAAESGVDAADIVDARMDGFDGDGGRWTATLSDGATATIVAPWPGGPISERPEVRREVVALYDEACRRLGVEPRPHA